MSRLWTFLLLAESIAAALVYGAFLIPQRRHRQHRFATTLSTTSSSTKTLLRVGSDILSETAARIPDDFTPNNNLESDRNDIEPELDNHFPLFISGSTRAESGDELDEEEDDDEEEDCLIRDSEHCLPISLVTLPRHSHVAVNSILKKTEAKLRKIHTHSRQVELSKVDAAKEAGRAHERIYANNYVDLGKIDT
jgi:hypothetical protein